MLEPDQNLLPLTEVVGPADRAGVAEAVRGASESDTPVYPLGGRTSLGYGPRPTEPGCGLSLASLDRVVDYPDRDLTITVEAGVTIAAVRNRLAAKGQRLPVDVPQADRATIGGAVSAGQFGPRRYLCGTFRDYVIGVEAVDGRGTPFSGGGRVVKNAAGYDLRRLLIGSLGTIGVITQVTLMVKPTPEATAMVACSVPDDETAERLLAELVGTETIPAAIELLAGPAWNDFLPPAESESGPRILVGFEGTSPEVDWMVERLGVEWQSVPEAARTSIRGSDCQRLWSRLTEFQGASFGGNGDASGPADGDLEPLCVRIHVLPSATVEVVRMLGKLDPGCSIQAHAGDGIVRARFSRPAEDVVASLVEQVRPSIAAQGGSLAVTSYPPSLRLGRTAVWGPPAPGTALMQTLKTKFDPHGILNRGRFIYEYP